MICASGYRCLSGLCTMWLQSQLTFGEHTAYIKGYYVR